MNASQVSKSPPAEAVVSQEQQSLDQGLPLKLDFEDSEGQGQGSGLGTHPEPESSDESDPKSEEEQDATMCACCQAEARVDRSIYGSECKKALNNVEKKEVKETGKKGPRWDKWVELKRAGGPQLFAVLLGYRKECSQSRGSGVARGNFDFAAYYEKVESTSSVGSEEKLLMMPFAKWLRVAAEDWAMDSKEATKKWERKERTLPDSKKMYIGKKLLLPMPYQILVVGRNEVTHTQGVRMEEKGLKKPKDEQVASLKGKVGTGGLDFGDQLFSKVGGNELLDNARDGPTLFAPGGESLFSKGGGAEAELTCTPKKKKLCEAACDEQLASTGQPENPKPAGKTRRKMYDLTANQNKLVDKINQELNQSRVTLDKAVKDALDAQEKGQKLSQDQRDFFQAYFDTVETRLSLVKAVLETDAGVATMLEQYKDKKIMVTDEDSKLKPVATFLTELIAQARSCKDEDAVKVTTQQAKDTGGLLKRLAAALTRSASDVKRAMEQKVKKAQAEVEKKRKAEEAKKKKDEQDFIKRCKRAQGKDTQVSCLWLGDDIVSNLFDSIPVYEDLDALKEAFKRGGALFDGQAC